MLGSGSSAGVPLIGCDCAVCTSRDPKNKRSRVSTLIEAGGKHILIDTSPDLRQQALDNNIKGLDAVLFTHDHADHTHGIDELRSFNYLADSAIPVYSDANTLKSLQLRFDYVFRKKPDKVWFRPYLEPYAIEDSATAQFEAAGVPFTAFTQIHGKTTSLGFRCGDFAYSTDVNELEPHAIEALKGTKVWFVDCLKYEPSYSHSYLEQTLRWIDIIKPQRAFLAHMTHDFDYKTLLNELPKSVQPGYDGLVVDL